MRVSWVKPLRSVVLSLVLGLTFLPAVASWAADPPGNPPADKKSEKAPADKKAEKAPAEKSDDKEPSPQQAEAVARVEKQIEAIQSRMMALQEQEFSLNMKVMETQQTANKGVESPAKAAEQLAKGAKTKGLKEYKALLVSCAQQVQAFDGKLFPLVKAAAGLEKDRPQVPDKLKARIDEVVNRVNSKHRSNLEKVAQLYELTAEWRGALGVYTKIQKDMPEAQRAKDTALIRKIADLSDKCGDYRNSLAGYKSLFDAKNPKERFNDRDLGEKLADAYEKCGDAKAAYAIYKGLLEALPKDKRDTDGKGIKDKMEKLEKQGGRPGKR